MRGIQPKLTVSEPDDKYEREAERVADAVMRMPEAETRSVDTQEEVPSDRIQRMCPRCQRRHRQGKPLNCSECEQELRRKPEADSIPVAEGVEKAAAVASEPGRPLSEGVKSFFENRIGESFGDVRVHTGEKADLAARSINAQAFTIGSDVVFRKGEYEPGTRQGRRLLAHELAHVVQQGRAGRFQIARENASGSGGPAARGQSAESRWWNCLKGAAVGAGSGIWGFIKAIGGSVLSPITAIKNAYNGIYNLLQQIWALQLGSAAKGTFPRIYKLAVNWTTLVSYERCRLIGAVVTEYGTGILSGAGAAKILKKLKRLKRMSSGTSEIDPPSRRADGDAEETRPSKPGQRRNSGGDADRSSGSDARSSQGGDRESDGDGRGSGDPSAAQRRALENLSGPDRKIIQDTMEEVPPTRQSFYHDVGLMQKVLRRYVSHGKTVNIGSYRGSDVFGSVKTGLGLADIDGRTWVVQKKPDGSFETVGPFR